MTRDQSLVRFCAETVMEWTPRMHPGSDILLYWEDVNQRYVFGSHWNPPNSWADAGQVWEKAAKKHVLGLKLGPAIRPNAKATVYEITGITVPYGTSGPRAITEAVARAFGWQPEGDPR